MTSAPSRRAAIKFGLAAAAAAFPARAQGSRSRLALVIGNSAYEDVNAVPAPGGEFDAPKIAERLTALKFEAVCEVNCNAKRLRDQVESFAQRLRAAGSDAVSFFFYEGHAAQDERQLNYLLPTDADTASAADVRLKGTCVDLLLDAYEAANNSVNVLVIDACRDWFADDLIGARPHGLYEIKRRGNVGIAMSTAPGMVALAGAGDTSPYSARLIEALEVNARDPLIKFFDDLHFRVRLDTEKVQRPDYLNSLSLTPGWSLASERVLVAASPSGTPRRSLVRTSEFLRTLDRARLVVLTNGRESFVDVLLSRRDILAENSLTTPERLAHFLAEIADQTGGFRWIGSDYSEEILKRIFRVRRRSGRDREEQERLFNLLYSNTLGNGAAESGDGWRYRQRGYFPIVGRANYRLMGAAIGVDLQGEPELLIDPEVALAAAAADWSRRNVGDMLDAGDTMRAMVAFDKRFHSRVEQRMRWLEVTREAIKPK